MTKPRGLAARLYQLALRAFPRRHRALYAAEMADTFERALESQPGRGPALRFTLAAALDALRAGIGERRRHRHGAAARIREALQSAARDLAHAVRSLSKARAFTLVSVASLGIGIGIVILMALVMRGLTGRPPGVVEDGLVELLVIPQAELRAQVNDWAIDTWSYPDLTEIRAAHAGLTVSGWAPAQVVVRAPGAGAARVDAMYVSPGYFAAVGVTLARGAGFTPEPAAGARTGNGAEAIVSHRAWRTRFAAREDIVGSTLVVDGTPRVVVGVTADGFRGHLASHRPGFDVWLPLDEHPRLSGSASLRTNRSVDWVHALGRLSAGTSLSDASGAVASVMNTIATRHPETNRHKSASVEPYASMGARRQFDTRTEAWSLVVAALLVLLVVCLNLSGMVMVRAATRERELAVRVAIGASRRRLIQYLLAEAVVLAVAGGALGASVVFAIPAILTWWAGQPLEISFRPDAEMGVVSAGLCLGASVLFGLLPAIRFSRPRVLKALKDEAGGGGRRVGRVHRWTAAVQAGIAVPFLVIGGVQLDQFRTSAAADLGFEPAGLFALGVRPGSDRGQTGVRPGSDQGQTTAGGGSGAESLLDTIQSHLARAGGVVAVSAADGLPLDSNARYTRVVPEGAANALRAHTTRIGPRYFETMSIPLRRGRGITADDQPGSEPVVVLSHALASRLFTDGDPIGRRVVFALEAAHVPVDPRWPHRSTPSKEQTFTVVGVTADLVDAYLGPPGPQLFVSLAQHPAAQIYVIARSSAAAPAMTAAFERATDGFYGDPDAVSANMLPAERLVRRARSELVLGSIYSAFGGGAALMLAALGVFGVIGFMVATRTREIGIRIALGATRTHVLRGVLLDSVRLAAWGVAGGLALAYLWVQEISWSAASAVEPLVYAAAVAIALGVALLAGLPAARRAAAVEPIVAMRAE